MSFTHSGTTVKLTLADAECHQRLQVLYLQGDECNILQLRERGIHPGITIYKCCTGYTVMFKIEELKIEMGCELCECIFVKVI